MKPRLEAAATNRVETAAPDAKPPRKSRPRKRRFAEIETPNPDTMPRPDGTPAELTEAAEAQSE